MHELVFSLELFALSATVASLVNVIDTTCSGKLNLNEASFSSFIIRLEHLANENLPSRLLL